MVKQEKNISRNLPCHVPVLPIELEKYPTLTGTGFSIMNDKNFPPITKGNQKARLIRFLVIFLPVILVLAILSITFYEKESAAREQLLISNEMFLLEKQTDILKSSLKSVVADLRVLSSHQELLAFLENGAANSLTALSNELLAFSTHRQIYDRIWFIDRQGMETIRVDYNYGVPQVVPQDELRHAGNRDDFRNTLKLKAGEFSMSPFVLNSTMGRIDNPPVPVITFGIPVFDRAGQRSGAIFLNYLGNQLLQPLKNLAEDGRRSVYLLNRAGYWLLGPTAQVEWGFLYPGKKDQTFQARFPAAWEAISGTGKGHVVEQAGLLTFTTFYPQLSLLEPSRAYLNADGPCGCYAGQNEDYYWKLISFVPAPFLQGDASFPLGRNLFYIDTILLLLFAGTAWLLAGTISQRNAVREKLQEKEIRLQTLLDNATEGIITIDDQGSITSFNPAAARIFGYNPEEAIGRSVNMLVPQPLAAEHDGYIKQFLDGGKARITGKQQEVTALHRDGTTIPLLLSVSAARENGQWIFTGMARDISDRSKPGNNS